MHPTADTSAVIHQQRRGAAGDAERWAASLYEADMVIASNARLLITLAVILSCARYAYPCTCADPPLEQKFKESSAVFIGEITGIERSSVKYYEYSVRFKVDRSWKGVAGSEIELFATTDIPGMCNDLPLVPGEKYLVYADADNDGCLYFTRECGPTANLSYATEEVEQLQSKFPLGQSAGLSATEIGTGALYVLSFIGGCLWLAKRRYEGH